VRASALQVSGHSFLWPVEAFARGGRFRGHELTAQSLAVNLETVVQDFSHLTGCPDVAAHGVSDHVHLVEFS